MVLHVLVERDVAVGGLGEQVLQRFFYCFLAIFPLMLT